MVKKYFSISIAKHGENRVVKDRKKWSKIGGSSVGVEKSVKPEKINAFFTGWELAQAYF